MMSSYNIKSCHACIEVLLESQYYLIFEKKKDLKCGNGASALYRFSLKGVFFKQSLSLITGFHQNMSRFSVADHYLLNV